MINKFYLEDPNTVSKETPEEVKSRERLYIVNWMKKVIKEKKTLAEQNAFLNKVHSVVVYHKISHEELLDKSV